MNHQLMMRFQTSLPVLPSSARDTKPSTHAYSGPNMLRETSPLRVGIGGPVGSGKTALTLSLCLALRDRYELAVVTNDIYTEEDAQFLVRNRALPPERILGVETGGCPHTAIREDASINLEAVAGLRARFPHFGLIFMCIGGGQF